MEKKLAYIIFCLFALLFLSSCKNKVENPYTALNAINDTCVMNPEKALLMLDSIKPEVAQQSDYIKKRWELLRFKAMDKAYMSITKDTLIRDLVRFFMKKGTANDKMEALYYEGRYAVEKGDDSSAIVCFMRAIDMAEHKKDIDTLTLANAYSHMSDILFGIGMLKEATKMTLKELEIVEKAGKTDPWHLLDASYLYYNIDKPDSAFYFGQRSLSLIKDDRSKKMFNEAISSMLALCSSLNKKKEADSVLNILETMPVEYRPFNYEQTKAIYFDKFGPVDSAIHYYKTAYDSISKITAKKSASDALVRIYENIKKSEEANKYRILYVKASDSISERIRERLTANTYNEYVDKKNDAAVRNEENKAIIMGGLLILSVAFFASLFIILQMKSLNSNRKKSLELREKERTLFIKKVVIEAHEEELEKRKKENEILEEEKAMLSKLAISSRIKVVSEDVMDRLRRAIDGKYILTEDDWGDFFIVANEKYPNFLPQITKLVNIYLEKNVHICYLLKMGMTNSEIEKLTQLPKSTIYNRVKKLRVMIGHLL